MQPAEVTLLPRHSFVAPTSHMTPNVKRKGHKVKALGGFPSQWAPALNPVDLPEGAPFDLAPGLVLRKASIEEVEVIRETLTQYARSPFGLSPLTSYELQRHETQQADKSSSINFTGLEPSDWRYNVVTNDGPQNQLYLAHLVSNVTAVPLEISALTFSGAGISMWRPGLFPRYFGHSLGRKALTPSREDIEQLVQLLREVRPYLLAESESPYPDVARAFSMYDALNFLMENSEFNVIGLFSIIEMLITHNPKLEDRGDSITHQMQAKLPLLMRRFKYPIDHGKYFGPVDIKKVWSALYAYRSAIAHGGVADFQKGSLQVLRSAQLATDFVRAVVQGLLRHVLEEPQLFHDLKNC